MRCFLALAFLMPALSFADRTIEECESSSFYPSERNICYGEVAQQSTDELAQAYESERAYFESGGLCYRSDEELDCKQALETLVRSQEAWKKYMDLKCKHVASRFNWKYVRADVPYWSVQRCFIETTNQRTSDLKASAP